MTYEEEWLNNLDLVKKFIDANNRKPTEKDGTNNSSLGSWITWQKQKYIKCTHIMKDINIRKLWEEFINNPKYSKYFK